VSALIKKIAAVSLAFTVSGSSAVAAAGDLIGSKWVWNVPPNDPDCISLPTEVATLHFGEQMVDAFLGCNAASGRYFLKDDGGITIKLDGMTNLFCGDPDYEDTFAARLSQSVRYEIVMGRFRLFDQDGMVILELTQTLP
jgi:heat shock protein HslJ